MTVRTISRRCRFTVYGSLLFLLLFVLSGCGSLYRQAYAPTGHVLTNYGTDELTPYLMSTDDISMACSMGESTSNLLLSFQRVIPPPNKTGLSSVFSAGLCSQLEAHEAELRHQRALYNGNSTEALDAQMERDRHLQTTTRRQYRAYKMFRAEYGDPVEGCPDFTGRDDRFYYLMGLLAGVQAANNDFTSGRAVGVPTSVLPKASSGAECLNSEEWWGIPQSLRAVTWTIVPGKKPEGADAWETLNEATRLADRSGVRLPYAFKVIAADNKGKMDLVKQTIQEAVASREKTPPPEKYRLLDAMAFLQMRMVSDRIWTKTKGHRTPPGDLGTFQTSNQEKPSRDEELNNLLPGS